MAGRVLRLLAASATALALSVTVTAGVASAAVAPPDPINSESTPYLPAKYVDVEICHSTSAVKNPYVTISPNVDGIVPGIKGGNAHGSHTGPVWTLGASGWGDIIPSFWYVPKAGGAAVKYPGLNWTTDGYAIWKAGCNPPAQPVLTLTKSASPANYSAASQTITYTFAVTNTSSVAIKNLAITETAFNGADHSKLTAASCLTTSLAAHASTTCTATYTIQTNDAATDGQTINNTAQATGESKDGIPVISNLSSATVTYHAPQAGTASLSLVKSASPVTYTQAGDIITYTFHVVNTGGVPLTDLAIVETAFSGSAGPLATPICAETDLAVGAQTDCTVQYTIVGADITDGHVSNTARATAKNGNVDVTSDPSSATVTYVPGAGSLTLVKMVNDAAGKNITASVDLSKWTLSAAKGGDRFDFSSGDTVSLAPGDYTLSENTVAGYTNGTTWDCGQVRGFNSPNTITIASRDSVTCTITNTQQVGSLTLKKKVNDTAGADISGSVNLNLWDLMATAGASTTSLKSGGVITVGALPTTYTLSESTVAGYTNGTSWVCDAGTFTAPNQIEVGAGQQVTCTITNAVTPTPPPPGGGTPEGGTPPAIVPPVTPPPAITVEGEQQEVPPVAVPEQPALPEIQVEGVTQEVGAPSANAHTGQGQSPWIYLWFAVGLALLGIWVRRRSHEA